MSRLARTNISATFLVFTSLKLYSGPIPSTGNSAPTGTLLATFDVASGSLIWDSSKTYGVDAFGHYIPGRPAVNGTLYGSDLDSLVSAPCTGTGVAGYARIDCGSDTGRTALWAYLTVGISGAEVILTHTQLVTNGFAHIRYFNVFQPY